MKVASAGAAAVAVLSALTYSYANSAPPFTLPPQSVYINPLSYNVLGPNATWRNNTYTTLFNPTNATPPFFQIFDPSFATLLGPSASLNRVALNTSFAFAHEAPVWVPETDEVTFTSNDGGALGYSDWSHNSVVSKISLTEAEAAIASGNPNISITVTPLNLSDAIQMTNGGTGTYYGNIILVTSGRALLPSSIALVNPSPPYNVTVILDNFFGRQFNSLNDVKVHKPSGNIFFTDTSYGYINHFRPAPTLPNQVYRLDPTTGTVKVVADGFVRNNGIAFSNDGLTAFVTDTGTTGFDTNQTLPATIYAYDIDPVTQAFTNRRVFAYADSGVPDGIQVDADGNVFSGCGDGVEVWNKEGVLIGKIYLGTTSANLVFAGNGRLVILAETAIYVANINLQAQSLVYP
ncbi:hypothetical protein JAAARDRAFT_184647 [Jaapia argillacea MUCL 33604]|uniref:SMP-30/Gluconolactonase/LRE-like region domain-containing protein n=1 Tax=Jaapia argillacea MUCL 33604 TaxID=933084 RepID=A0A067PA82_9AGAM|nr:hypothetical protein JAAARDRAFT_184647 [Jaapia argillacea MUCL 33604]